MNPGDAVFFKKAKKSSHRKAQEIEFKGTGFGVFLGAVPLFKQDPTPHQLLQAMGQIGFLTFYDVAEFLGEDSAYICIKKYEDKYYGKEMTPEQMAEAKKNMSPEQLAELERMEAEEALRGAEGAVVSASPLLNANGLPLTPPNGESLIVIPGEGIGHADA